MFNATELEKEVAENGGVMKPFWPGDDADDVDLEEKPVFLDIEDLRKSDIKPFWMYPDMYKEFQGETSSQKVRRKRKISLKGITSKQNHKTCGACLFVESRKQKKTRRLLTCKPSPSLVKKMVMESST